MDVLLRFVFVVGKEMEAEWRNCLEKMEGIEEFGWSMQVLARGSVIGLDEVILLCVYGLVG
jgi:hypothetical protein